MLFIVPAAVIFFVIMKDDADTLEFNAAAINIIFIATPLIFYIMKAILTSVCCFNDKKVYLKLTTNTGMPVWACRETFKPWQIILIYSSPVILLYPVLLILGIISGGEIYLLVLIIIMSFLMSYDIALIIYVLFLKIYKPDYIALDNHVYNLTLYYKTPVIESEHKKIMNLNKIKEINFKIPKIHFQMILPVYFGKKH